MVKKLTKHGNSMALVIDRPVLDLLGIGEDTPLGIATDGEPLVITPVRDKRRRMKLDRAIGKVNARYGRMLRNLAR